MMQTFATDIITRAALAAGLPEGRVIDKTQKDNLTIKRPRMELQFMPERYTRSGRTLGLSRDGAVQTRKRELYVVEQDVAANAMADDEAWLERFSYAFIAALPAEGMMRTATGSKSARRKPPSPVRRTSGWETG